MIESIMHARPASGPMSSAEYLLAPHVVLLCLQDGTGRLLDLGGNFYALSQSAAAMLSGALTEGTAATIRKMTTIYQLEPACIERDLHIFLRGLEKKQLIYRPTTSCRSQQQRGRRSSLILSPLLYGIHIWPSSLQTKIWLFLALTYVALRLSGWPATVEIWRSFLHGNAKSVALTGADDEIKMIRETVQTVASRHLLRVECKERALCCWGLLHLFGVPASLVVGIDLFPLASHCWCEAGHTIMSDEEDRCQNFTPVLVYE